MIKIIVDCYGGDHSPDAHIDGSLEALKKFDDLHITLTGNEDELREKLKGKEYDPDRLAIEDAKEVISCDEKPTDAIRTKKESSMMKAVKLLLSDEGYAGMVSTGSTGALVAAATLKVGRLKGVKRPAFCPILPTMNGGIVGVCDSGANVDISPEYLRQFAIMGSLYMENVYGIKNPRVALLNIGTEEAKGDELHKQGYALLKETPGINFVGNMESRDLMSGNYDLVVCDGFSGNVMIKTTEGTALELLKKIKTDIKASLINKIGALFMMKMFKKEKQLFDYQNYGGSILLGTKKPVVKGHGSSKATAIEKCIEQAYRADASTLAQKTEELIAEAESKPETVTE